MIANKLQGMIGEAMKAHDETRLSTLRLLSSAFNYEFIAKQHKLSEDEIPLLALSCGTQDQLFFAMKLSLLNLLSPSKKLPLFLDDPFVNFDHDRRKKALELLKEISRERQIFLFTYDPWYIEHLGKEAELIHMDQSPTQTQ